MGCPFHHYLASTHPCEKVRPHGGPIERVDDGWPQSSWPHHNGDQDVVNPFASATQPCPEPFDIRLGDGRDWNIFECGQEVRVRA